MGKQGCAPPVIKDLLMVDDIIYKGLSPIKNFENHVPRWRGIIISLVLLMI